MQVIDDRGCIFDSIFYITQPDPLNFNIDYIDSATCSQNNGSLNGYAYGGTYPYNYAWSDGSYGNYPSNDFAPGNNFVIITDANNCIDTSGFTIPISNSLAASSVQENDVSCYGGSNGSASVNLSDNYPVVYYNWFDGSSDPTISGLATGTYAVTITDNNGCTSILGFTVNEPLPVNFVTNQIYSATCSQNNGGINGYGSGGTYPYTYSGSSGSFGNSIPNTFGAGNNLLIVTDQNGCTDSVTFSVPLSNTLAASTVNVVNVNCYNTSNGSASVHLSDPYPQVTYSWFDGSSGSTIINLSAGNYAVTIDDNNGCTAAMSFTITQPDPIAVAIDTGSGILCNGANTIVQISATGGNPPYSGVGSFSYGAGTYNVSITDNGGCAAPDTSFTIYGPPPIVASVNIDTTPLCSILTATISVIATGGAPAYTAYLDGSEQGISFTDSALITGVAAGQHNVIIYDANNCFSSVGFNINAYTPDNIVTNINSPLCYGLNNGNVTLITSGYSPFTYQNNTFTNSYEIDSLTAGIDTFIIYNNVGCADTVIVSITQPDSLSLYYTAYPTSPCFTDSTLVTISAFGGTPAYTGTGQFNFPSGNTQVIVIDGNSCRDTMNVEITYPHPFSVTASVLKQPDCTQGTVLITGTGGYSPYTLHLDSVNTLSFTDTISISISGGTYVYAITDNRGCTQLATFYASPHLPILVDSNIISSGITCHSPADAVIQININGGGAPGYTYQLNGPNGNVGPQAGNTFINLGPGNYMATVTDSLGCSVQITAHIAPYLPGTDSISVTNLRCNGAATGAIKIYSQPADRGPYTYSLNGGTPQVYNVFYGLTAGNYVVTVSDVNGCIDTVHATITQPDTIDGRVWLNGQLLPIDSFTINQRQFATFSKLNTNPWSIVFSPNNPTTLSNDSVIQIQPTEDVSYVVTVYEDSADFDCFVQYQGLVEVIPIPLLPDLITPNGDGANDTWKIDQVKYPTPQVIIFDRWGEIVFRSDAYNNDWGGVYTNGKPVPDGTYFYIMKVPSQNNAVFKGDINVLNASR